MCRTCASKSNALRTACDALVPATLRCRCLLTKWQTDLTGFLSSGSQEDDDMHEVMHEVIMMTSYRFEHAEG